MEEPSFWATVLGSAVLGGFVTAIYSKINNDKNLSLKYVTEERQKWRYKIKEQAAFIYANPLENEEDIREFNLVSAEFRLNLNPLPSDPDHIIIHYVNLIRKYPKDEEWRNKFIVHVAYMLKHDWERSKKEAGIRKGKHVEREHPK
ncbi:hypothetical protein [Brevibacillus sp. NRS-1366]|uniref:hypothetical protein n=1 Tax=Brevibacillus sp. NRS-1366 TaxID=3233899 RepID=UPI003D1D886C